MVFFTIVLTAFEKYNIEIKLNNGLYNITFM